MKISTAAWHYKVVKAFNDDPPEDLCGYVRSVIGHSLLLVLLSPLVPIMWVWDKVEDGFVWTLMKCFPYKPKRYEPEPEERKESLWRAWLRAKKEKVCPLIEFTDESREDDRA